MTRSSKYLVGVAIAVALIGTLLPYAWRVDIRSKTNHMRQCHTEQSRQGHQHYTATYCYGPGEHVVLRLYRSSNMDLIAERMFRYPRGEPVRLTWDQDAVVYDTAASDGEGIIELPPSFGDRLLAKLP
ncbi:hypothetical protein [Burkholderia stabilis]|uniref:hypothetical protein n=1 Tax=Burkholderia stabilis TaxID=95485 RepID=UPI0012E9D1C4|nr:hypothetical protein [Burkholderia stabilis]HDR9492757.1 hypothetical protein [Burkholderia stabilis]HDR9525082.1 hypothetical protein [Burkholderia stabilis]HDR9532217.1 hypothetical protein [Burkholderia stabilis]HDR9540068.1 hypothetical protein [Burkholderia stabilis]HDR9548486.1 hypothetical protein [Burkholderia stabilis]